MTIEQLYQYIEVCRYHSITLAANMLNISRQSISTTIKKLETEFNTELFIRLQNGVALTKSGKALYQHAQTVINDITALKQSMAQYSPQIKPLNTCNIGVSKPIMTYYGNYLYQMLSETFPDTYFHFSIFIIENDNYPFEEFDISIILMSDITMKQFAKIPPEYIATWIRSYLIYIWISGLSSWNSYTTLDFKLLKDIPICLFKDFVGKSNLFSYLYHNINEIIDVISIVELEQNLCTLIENRGYYTIDIPLWKNQLSYKTLFSDRNIVPKATSNQISIWVVYRQKTCANFYPIIAASLAPVSID